MIRLLPLTLLLPSLCAQTTWNALTPTTNPPAFTAHAMAYDLGNDRTVLFGGLTGGARTDQTWLFDRATWTQATPTTVPPARVAHPMTYDVGRGRVVMFGGIGLSGGVLGDTWEWNGTDWLQLTPATAPSARRSHPMVYHPGRATTLLWGGFATADQNDLWEWNGATWTAITTTTSPSPRRASDMAYDPNTGGILLFSGYQQSNDTWLFDGTDWVQQFPATSPSARYDHSMTTDLLRNRIVMFGGPGAADTWEWDGSNWQNRAPATQPPARSDTYLAYDWVLEQVVMFGSSAIAETWTYGAATPGLYTTSGTGCPGTNSLPPRIGSTERPWLGETFDAVIDQLPAVSIAFMTTGFSNTTSAFGPLPLNLAPFGLPGCLLQIDPAITLLVIGSGGSAIWSRPVPNDAGLLGVSFYNQAAAIDTGANTAGLTVSNAARATIGGK